MIHSFVSIREEGTLAALKIRKDRTPTALRKLAKEADDARVARRILAIANALVGMSREDAARAAGMDSQTLRDWVLRYNAHGVEASGLSAYTLEDLADICKERFGKSMHPWSLGRLLKKLGLSRQKTRPIHPETDPVAAAAFKKHPAHSSINP